MMYVYVKEYQCSPRSSKPSTPEMQQVKVESKGSESKRSPAAAESKFKIEAKQFSSKANTQVSAPEKPSSVKKEAHHQAVKAEMQQTPEKTSTESLIGKRPPGTPIFGQLSISQSNIHI
jgi:hypothetical protein